MLVAVPTAVMVSAILAYARTGAAGNPTPADVDCAPPDASTSAGSIPHYALRRPRDTA